MVFEFIGDEVHISMVDYLKKMIKEFSLKLSKEGTTTTPATVELFKEDTSKKLNRNEGELFH